MGGDGFVMDEMSNAGENNTNPERILDEIFQLLSVTYRDIKYLTEDLTKLESHYDNVFEYIKVNIDIMRELCKS